MTSAAVRYLDHAPPLPSVAPITLDAVHVGPVPALPGEHRHKRVLFGSLAVALTIGYFFWVFTYWLPIHLGTDQNGYLVGGKQIAQTLSMRQAPREIAHPEKFDPHFFVGHMWVAAANDSRDFFPKYPVGLPAIYAVCLWVGGSYGVILAYLVSPICMALTVGGVFVLVRQFAGSFPAILAMLVFATSPTITNLVNNPNSHASTVFCVTWGMIAVLHWWRYGGLAWAIVGGVLVGYATTIRYTEGALVLPLAWAAVMHLRWRDWRRWIEAAVLMAAWSLPVGLLVLHNMLQFGMITGYDGTSESVGFSWEYAAQNWETFVRQMSENGLFLIMPLAVTGLIAMFWWSWRLAVFLWLWAAPTIIVYIFYYWAPDSLGYMRFFVTVMPALLVGAFWLAAHLRDLVPAEPQRLRWRWMAPAMITAVLVATVAAFYLPRISTDTFKELFSQGSWHVQSYADFMQSDQPAYVRMSAAPAFFSALVVVAITAAVAVAAGFIGRGVLPTLAAGVLAFLSIAVQSDNSAALLERDSYDRAARLVAQNDILRVVPEDAVVICRDQATLNALQFAANYRTYSGETFNKAAVDGRKASEGPDPIDPARVQQLKKALETYDQNALNDQARRLVREALESKRRVFIVETQRINARDRNLRRAAASVIPDFIRRYLDRGKDKPFEGKVVSNVTVYPPVEGSTEYKPRRGRVDLNPMRPFGWQIWEIKARAS